MEYTYTVAWSPQDDAFVAKVLEFKSLAAHGETRDEALFGLRLLVKDVVDHLKKNGEVVPEPRGEHGS
jgi:predicted RNase H-like HicB family nuclease